MGIEKTELLNVVETATAAVGKAAAILTEGWEAWLRQDGVPMRYAVKEDRSPVTATDREVERVLREAILQRHPRHRILGEEGGGSGDEASPFLWALDPIDGTKQFVRGLQFFGIQVAVMHEGRVVAGVSCAPVLGQTLVAWKGGGAFLDKTPLRVSDVDRVDDVFMSHGEIIFFQRTGKLPQLIDLCEAVWGTDGFSDFWSYHDLASGKLDAVIEAETNVWDIAAASIIVEEAGGRATDLDGRPVGPETTSFVATNGRVHDAVLGYLAEARGRRDVRST